METNNQPQLLKVSSTRWRLQWHWEA